MNFTTEVCENFFDFSRDLNRSNELISSIYELMLSQKEKNPEIFEGIERRLCRASNSCMKADDFVKLTNIALKNLVVPFNTDEKSLYVALVFYISEWMFDQTRLCISGATVEETKNVIIGLMAKKLTEEFNFDSRAKWYKFVSEYETKPDSATKEESFDFPSFFIGVGLSYLLIKM